MRFGLAFKAVLLLVTLLLAGRAHAQSDEQLNGFAMDIERKCRSSIEEYKLLSKPVFLVDPLGSSSYGVVLAKETDPSARPDTVWLCIYSRATKKIEMIELSDSKLNFEPTPSTLPEFRKK